MSKKAFETCTVRISSTGRTGSEYILNQIEREKVTPPEFKILVEQFGEDHVVFLKKTGPAKNADGSDRSNAEECDRLKDWYGRKLFAAVFGRGKRNPVLDTTFEQAGIHTSKPDNVRQLPKKGKAKKKEEDLEDEDLDLGDEFDGADLDLTGSDVQPDDTVAQTAGA